MPSGGEEPGSSVTAICTFRDAAATLPATLDGLAAQTLQHFAVLLIDDDSRDGGSGIASAMTERDSRFRLLKNPGSGRAQALNFALRQSRTPLVAIMDGDDVPHPAWLETTLRLFEELPPDCAALGCGRVTIRGAQAARWDALEPCDPRTADVTALLCRGNPITHSGAMLRRAALEQIGGYDEALRFGADYDLWVRLAAGGWRIARTGQVLVAKRYHPGQKFARQLPALAASLRNQARAIKALDGNLLHYRWLAASCLPLLRGYVRGVLRNIAARRPEP